MKAIATPSFRTRSNNYELIHSWNRRSLHSGGIDTLLSRDIYRSLKNPDRHLVHEGWSMRGQRSFSATRADLNEREMLP